jgi:hypothetical protein
MLNSSINEKFGEEVMEWNLKLSKKKERKNIRESGYSFFFFGGKKK